MNARSAENLSLRDYGTSGPASCRTPLVYLGTFHSGPAADARGKFAKRLSTTRGLLVGIQVTAELNRKAHLRLPHRTLISNETLQPIS